MSTSLMYHTQGIKGFQHKSSRYEADKVIQRIEQKEFFCEKCGSCNITLQSPHIRLIQGIPTLKKKLFFEIEIHMMKEALRSIYKEAGNEFQAEAALKNWCSIARETQVKELGDMASCVENHLNGILAYWTYNGLSNASMKGFNNKIRWLIRQAYGYHDEEYFHLKIFDLPKINIKLKL